MRRAFLVVLLLAVAGTAPAEAQREGCTLHGDIVSGPAGHDMPPTGTRVHLFDSAGEELGTTTTSASGSVQQYTFTSAPVTFEQSLSVAVVHAGHEARVDFSVTSCPMPVPDITEKHFTNDAPAVTAWIDPGMPLASEALQAFHWATDANDDTVEVLSTVWLRKQQGQSDFVQQASYDGQDSVPASTTAAGDEWMFQITVGDQHGASSMAEAVVVVASPEQVPVAVIELLSDLKQGLDNHFSFDGSGSRASQANPDATLDFLWQLDEAAAETPGFDLRGLGRGQHTVQLIVTDDQGYRGIATMDIFVNEAPVLAPLALPPVIRAGDAVAVTASAEDPDTASAAPDDEMLYTFAWYDAGGDCLAEPSPIGAQGPGEATHTLSSEALPPRDTCLLLEVTVDDGFETDHGQATRIISNTPPEIGDAVLTGGDRTVPIQLSIAEIGRSHFFDADGDPVSCIVGWTLDEAAFEPETGACTGTFSGDVARGQTVGVTVTPTDGTDEGEQKTASFIVENALPRLGALAIPDVDTTQDITIQVADLPEGAPTFDADGDLVMCDAVWSVDGDIVGEQDGIVCTDASLPAGTATKADTVALTLTPYDGFGSGIPAAASLTIGNAAPVLDDVLLASSGEGPPRNGDTLHLTFTVGDPDPDALTCTVAWFRDAVKHDQESVDCTVGAAQRTGLAKGETWSATVLATDGEDTHSVSSNTLTVANTPPSLIDLALQVADTTQPITAAAVAEDVDGDSVVCDAAWTVDGVPVKSESGISCGAASLEPGVAGKGQAVQLTLTPSDGEAGQPASASGLVANAPPSVGAVALVAGDVRDPVTVLIADLGNGPTFDPDGDAVTCRADWFVDDVLRASDAVACAEAFLAAGEATKGHAVRLVLTPTDGESDGEAVEATAMIANALPTVDGIVVGPAGARTGDALTATATTSDADDDPVRCTFEWLLGGSVHATQTDVACSEGLLPSSHTTKGQSWSARVIPLDPEAGEAATSGMLTVENSLPTVTVTLPSGPSSSEQLVATLSASDADGDVVSCLIEWLRDGTVQESASRETCSGEAALAATTASGQVWTVRATPSDGTGTGSPASATATVGNGAPVITHIDYAKTVAGDLEATPAASDPDGDPLTCTFRWLRAEGGDLVEVRATTRDCSAATLEAATHRKGDHMIEITAHDGQASSPPTRPQEDGADKLLNIPNHAPVVTDPSLTKSSPFTHEDTEGSATATDIDGDPVTLSYAWRRLPHGPDVEGATLPATSTARGETWRLSVTATDASEEVMLVSSATAHVTIQDTAPAIDELLVTPADRFDHLDLVASATGSDADGDVITFSFAWTHETTTVTGATLAATHTAPGQTWTVTATPMANGLAGPAVSAQVTIEASPDTDGDGALDHVDNCPAVANAPSGTPPSQADVDGDGVGDACDSNADDGPLGDQDGDTIPNGPDNCPAVANAVDHDGNPATPRIPGPNIDGDALGDACDADATDGPLADKDGDGVANGQDNCAAAANSDQADADADGVGNACDPDYVDPLDPARCADHPAGLPDLDGDGTRDLCDADRDGDGVPDAVDLAPGDATLPGVTLTVTRQDFENGSMLMQWTIDGAATVRGFEVYVDGVLVAELGADARTIWLGQGGEVSVRPIYGTGNVRAQGSPFLIAAQENQQAHGLSQSRGRPGWAFAAVGVVAAGVVAGSLLTVRLVRRPA